MSTVPVTLIRGRHPRKAELPRERKPPWLTVRAPGSEGYLRLKTILRRLDLRTVCEEANCPNIGECWHHGTATFMILGDVCTRACGYCNVVHGSPGALDREEPRHLAAAVSELELQHVVVTSVDRDDLDDGGAGHFADTIRQIRQARPTCRVEVLIPDFSGRDSDLRTVLDAGPDILNHNIETVARLYRTARPAGRYHRALELLDRSRRYAPHIPTKSGVMVGLGESWEELVETLGDLAAVGCRILTVGQYLRPTVAHLPVARYYEPAEFDRLAAIARDLGFGHVESGPLVRSSYHAHEQATALRGAGSTRP
jgi:lipoic acid synthetase